MELVVPIFYGDRKFIECEIKKPSGGVIADTKKIYDQGNIFSSLYTFISGCVSLLMDENGAIVEDANQIRTITKHLKERAAEKLAVDIMMKYDPNDGIEGIYGCPRCGNQIICELNDDTDTRDYISDLKVIYFDKEKDYLEIDLTTPFEIKGRETAETIYRLGFRYPTLEDTIQAYAKHGNTDRVRMQYDIYLSCLVTSNGEEIDKSWKNRYGSVFFEKYDEIRDINKIAREMNKYGLETKKQRSCNKCGKTWEAHINTSNFFDSVLQSREG